MNLSKNELKEARDALIDRSVHLQCIAVKFEQDNLTYTQSALDKVLQEIVYIDTLISKYNEIEKKCIHGG